jgi:hypothetical protein
MRFPRKSVPLIPLKDFGSSPFLEHGIFVDAFADCVNARHWRMQVHRHDYVELFLLQGRGSVLTLGRRHVETRLIAASVGNC